MPNSIIKQSVPFIDDSDIESVNTALKYYWGDRRGEGIKKAEELISEITRQRFTHLTSHCTGALHTAFRVLKLGQGDQIIAPNLSWVASVAPAIHEGCCIKLVDVDLETGCISINSILENITHETKAVIGVNLFGNACNWKKLREICNEFDCFLIEDNAEGLGGFFNDHPLGSFGDISCTSFHATKIVTAGQGGAISTSIDMLQEPIKSQIHHGMLRKSPNDPFYWSKELGCNYTYSDMQAALVVSQIQKLKQLVDKRRHVYYMYEQALKEVNRVSLNCNGSLESNKWMILASIDGIRKEKVVSLASEEGIEIRPCFYNLSEMPPFEDFEQISTPNSDYLSTYCFSLPNGMHITETEIEKTVDCLKSICNM